jgi:hypothetical protein
MSLRGHLFVFVLALPVVSAAQNSGTYSESLLNTKRIFSEGLAAALGEPFEGIVVSDGKREALFPIESTGVSIGLIVGAATEWLSLLDDAQLSRSQFAIDDPEWRNWSNVDVGIFARLGLSLEEMNDSQKIAAWNLFESSLSAVGIEKVKGIMRTEQTLLEINQEPLRYGEEKYYLTVMGVPSSSEPWGWQLDGHHLVLNFFVLGDQVVMTPAFWGGEPIVTETGKYAGNIILQDEQDFGLALMTSLNPSQRSAAIIEERKIKNDQLAAANADNLILDYAGLPASEMEYPQRSNLLNLIGVYVNNLRRGHAKIKMEEVEEYLDETYFAWIGGTDETDVFYYRIHSPVILIEFDHQNPVGSLNKNPAGIPTRDHIHSVVRTPNGNDYGKDLLRQHLLEHH